MNLLANQFGTQNPWFRVGRSVLAGLAVVYAQKHIPGWDNATHGWMPIGDALFDGIPFAIALLSGLITSEPPAPPAAGGG